KEARSLEAMAGYNWVFDFLLLPDGSESVTGMAVTLDYFSVIGVKPLIGRAFLDSDAPTARVQATVAMLSHELWQRRFNGDPHIVGKIVHISRYPPFAVVGVMPPDIRFLPPSASMVWSVIWLPNGRTKSESGSHWERYQRMSCYSLSAKVWHRFWWESVAESWAHWGWVTSSPAGCLVWKALIRRSSPSARS